MNKWEHPIDHLYSTRRKKLKDKYRRIFIQKIKDKYEVTIEHRIDSYKRINVLENLWRIVPAFSEWGLSRKLTLSEGIGIFTIDNLKFNYNVEPLNDYQINIVVSYEQRDVSAEEAGRIPPFIEIFEGWHHPKA